MAIQHLGWELKEGQSPTHIGYNRLIAKIDELASEVNTLSEIVEELISKGVVERPVDIDKVTAVLKNSLGPVKLK